MRVFIYFCLESGVASNCHASRLQFLCQFPTRLGIRQITFSTWRRSKHREPRFLLVAAGAASCWFMYSLTAFSTTQQPPLEPMGPHINSSSTAVSGVDGQSQCLRTDYLWIRKSLQHHGSESCHLGYPRVVSGLFMLSRRLWILFLSNSTSSRSVPHAVHSSTVLLPSFWR